MHKPAIGLLVVATALLATLLVACGGDEGPNPTADAGQPAAPPTVEAMREDTTATPVSVLTSMPRPTGTPTSTPATPLNVYESGQTIPDFPSGSPNVVRGSASLQISGGNVVITMGNGGTVEYSHATYTCVSAEGCSIENGRVTAGTIRITDPSNVENVKPVPTARPISTHNLAPGDVLTFKHDSFGIHIELEALEVTRGYAGDESSDRWLDSGNEWVKVVIEVKNLGEDEYSFLSPRSFALVDANYSELGDTYGAPDTGNLMEGKTIAPKATVQGDIVWQAPISESFLALEVGLIFFDAQFLLLTGGSTATALPSPTPAPTATPHPLARRLLK